MIDLIDIKNVGVGDIFYLVPSDKRNGKTPIKVSVVSVGRKYFFVAKENQPDQKIQIVLRSTIGPLNGDLEYVGVTVDHYPDSYVYQSLINYEREVAWSNVLSNIGSIQFDNPSKEKIIELLSLCQQKESADQ